MRSFLAKYSLARIAILFVCLVLSSYASSTIAFERKIFTSTDRNHSPGEELHFVAELRWIPLEGGFYGLVAEDGRKFLPLNLPDDFRKDGLKTRVRGIIREDVATIYMWGTPLEIIEIEVLD
jgi:hypothetical protein